MRRVTAVLSSLVLLTTATAAGQNLIEGRLADTKYRYLDYGHTWHNAAVLDLFYVGVPGSDELNLGGGYGFVRGGLVVTPLAYAVIGRQDRQRGIKLALLVAVEHRGWKLLSFLGQYLPISGEVDTYLVLDALDVTRKIGSRLELGIESGFFHTGGDWNPQIGPVLKLNDKHGGWAVSFRFGSEDELRGGRVVTF